MSTCGFSLSYKISEQIGYLWPQLAEMPLAATILGAIFVGVGAGICVRAGGAPGGDDAIAMCITHKTGCKIEFVYLFEDFIVLFMSMSYIPFSKIGYSFITVILSGQLVGIIQRMQLPKWRRFLKFSKNSAGEEMSV